jgi:hypothetical protein
MYCATCGTEIVDNAQYCHKCGTASGSTSIEQSQAASPDYELCKLNPYIVKNTSPFVRLVNPFARDCWCWFAETISAHEKDTVAKSSEFRERYLAGVAPGSHDAQAARDEIIAKLLGDGWEPIDTNYKDQSFRRRIR